MPQRSPGWKSPRRYHRLRRDVPGIHRRAWLAQCHPARHSGPICAAPEADYQRSRACRFLTRPITARFRSRIEAFVLTMLPYPVADFWHVLSADDDVIGVLGELVAHELAQVGGPVAELRNSVDGINDQMEPVEVVADDHVERGSRGALIFEAADVEVVVVIAAICEPVNEPWIAMEGNQDRLVGRK